MLDDEITIDRGIPMPKRPSAQKYPWRKLEVGESFFVPCEGKRIQEFQSQTWNAGRAHNRKFATRRENGGIRVWRIE